MQILKSKDGWLGLALVVYGGWSYMQSQGFDEVSRAYPMFLSAAILLIGLLFCIKTVLNKNEYQETLSALLVRIRGPFLLVLIIGCWALLMSIGLGYLVSSLLAVFLILSFISDANKARHAYVATIIVASVFILFDVIFDVPLPLDALTESVFM